MYRLQRAMTVVTAMAMGSGVALLSPAMVSSAAASPPQVLTCGSTVTHNTQLAADVGPCATDGLIISSSNVRLDLNGHKVFGALNSFGSGAAADDVGIHFINATNSTVSDGEVTGFAAGVRIDNGANNTVTRINAHDNISPIAALDNGDGISVWNSSYNAISHNVVTHNGEYSGISLVTGDYNCTAPANPTRANPCTAVNPAMSGTGNSVLDNQVTNNNVAVCSRRANGQPGTCTPASTGVPVPFGSQIPGSVDTGVRVEGPNMTNSDVERNTVSDAGNNGIMVDPSCHDAFIVNSPTCTGDVGNIHTLVKDNVSNHNGYGRTTGFGINLFGMGVTTAIQGSLDTVVGNTTEFNKDGGIVLYSSSCYPTLNDPRQCAATDDTVVNNTSSFNGLSLGVNTSQGDGIEMSAGADRNNVSHNTLNGNDSDGIGVEMAQEYTAGGQPVVDANGNPVYIPGSGASNNVLFANQAAGNHYFDGEDQNPGCDNNDWDLSAFGTVNQPCVLDSDQPGDQPGNSGANHGVATPVVHDAPPISHHQGDPGNS
jgi:hypothetical protein